MIYFVQAGDTVKIGYGADPWRRIQAIRTHTPHSVKVLGIKPGSMHDERALHKRFAAYRAQREWFHLSDEIKSFIASECFEMVEEKKTRELAPHRKEGERLAAFRLAKGIKTHKDFIARSGVNHSTYADIENGKRQCGMVTALKLIARHPELSLDYLYLGRIGTIDGASMREAVIQITHKRATSKKIA